MQSLSPTNIAWSRYVWNPQTGCTFESPGCDNCYALAMSKRLHASGSKKYRNKFRYTEHPDELNKPLHHKNPTLIFVNSMSDVFIKTAKQEFIASMFEIMMRASWHKYQILTKRPDNMAAFIEKWLQFKNLRVVPDHIWLGTSVENSDYEYRIDILRTIPAMVRFVSYEPALGPISPSFEGIRWMIIGGESGPGRRPFDPEWAKNAIHKARQYGTRIFFKQMGGRTPKAGGTTLDGQTIMEYPMAIA